MCGMNAINEHIACISLSLCIGAIDYVLFNVVRAMWMQNQAGAQTCAERIHIHVKECQIPRKWIASLYSTANYNIAVRTLNLLCTLQLLAPIKIKNLKKKNERTNANTYTQRQRIWTDVVIRFSVERQRNTEKPRMFLCYRVVYHCFNEN